jgi:hypothetical protein
MLENTDPTKRFKEDELFRDTEIDKILREKKAKLLEGQEALINDSAFVYENLENPDYIFEPFENIDYETFIETEEAKFTQAQDLQKLDRKSYALNETTVKGLPDKHLEFLKRVQLFRIYLDNLAYYYDISLFGLNNFQWMRSASFSKLTSINYYYYYDHVLNPTNEKALDDFQ